MSEKMCKVVYLLNEKGRKESLLSGGDGKKIQILYAPITNELLELAEVDKDGNAVVKIGFKGDISREYWHGVKKSTKISTQGVFGTNLHEPIIMDIEEIKEFNKLQSVESLLEFEKNRVSEYNKSLVLNEEKIKPLLLEFEEKKDIYEKEELRKQELQEKRKQEWQEKERLKALQKEEDKKEDEHWIKTKGSDYLKQCLNLGYNCKRKYMEERVEKEFPGFELDFDNEASWNARVSPSQDALDEVTKWIEKGFDAKIVWLTTSVYGSEYDYENDFEECEAIAFEFKNYWLVKQI